MSKFFITGDTHGGYGGFSGEMKRFSAYEKMLDKLNKDDYLIIAGDFGFIWKAFQSDKDEERWLRYFDSFGFTTLFIDGNHENFDRLDKMEVSEFKGGKVHKISDSVYHLMRGQIYDFDGVKIFTMGGALSIDKEWRTPGISWWKQELITQKDFDEAMKNLAKVDFSVDFVITHTCPQSIVPYALNGKPYNPTWHDESCVYLQKIYEKIKFKKWYFGHWHEELLEIGDEFITLWHDIVEIKI